jgi:acyl-CoA thioesterase FadM
MSLSAYLTAEGLRALAVDVQAYAVSNPLPFAAGLFAVLFALQHLKVLPFVYHVRTISAIVSGLWQGRFRKLSDPVVTRGRVVWGDLDWNMHMNNSVYALEIDIQRYIWFLRLLSGNLGNYFGKVLIANGGVSHYFLKEMRWNTRYIITTRLVAVDKRWAYLESRFTSPNGKTLYAVGVTRIIFKALKGGSKAAVAGGAYATHSGPGSSNSSSSGGAGAGAGAGKGQTISPEDVFKNLGYDTTGLPGTTFDPAAAKTTKEQAAAAWNPSNDVEGRDPEALSGLFAGVLDCLEPGRGMGGGAAAATGGNATPVPGYEDAPTPKASADTGDAAGPRSRRGKKD